MVWFVRSCCCDKAHVYRLTINVAVTQVTTSVHHAGNTHAVRLQYPFICTQACKPFPRLTRCYPSYHAMIASSICCAQSWANVCKISHHSCSNWGFCHTFLLIQALLPGIANQCTKLFFFPFSFHCSTSFFITFDPLFHLYHFQYSWLHLLLSSMNQI